jgi:hypothetical protein
LLPVISYFSSSAPASTDLIACEVPDILETFGLLRKARSEVLKPVVVEERPPAAPVETAAPMSVINPAAATRRQQRWAELGYDPSAETEAADGGNAEAGNVEADSDPIRELLQRSESNGNPASSLFANETPSHPSVAPSGNGDNDSRCPSPAARAFERSHSHHSAMAMTIRRGRCLGVAQALQCARQGDVIAP